MAFRRLNRPMPMRVEAYRLIHLLNKLGVMKHEVRAFWDPTISEVFYV